MVVNCIVVIDLPLVLANYYPFSRIDQWIDQVIGTAIPFTTIMGREQYQHYLELNIDNQKKNNSASVSTASICSKNDSRNISDYYNLNNVLERYLYRNSVYHRLHNNQRFTAMVQIDIYNLKEITSVATFHHVTNSSTSNGAGGGNSNSELSYRVSDQIIVSSSSTHSSAMDVSARVKLTRHKGDNNATKSQKPINQKFKQAEGVDNYKYTMKGAVNTPARRSDPMLISKATSNSANNNNNTLNYYNPSNSSMTKIVASTDYVWREQIIFQFPLPEGVNKLSHSANKLPSELLHSNNLLLDKLFTAPNTLIIKVYEKTFFSENKLGDVVIDLNTLSNKRYTTTNCYRNICFYYFKLLLRTIRAIRDWFPLRTNNNRCHWLVFLQIKLKFQQMTVELPSDVTTKIKNSYTTLLNKISEDCRVQSNPNSNYSYVNRLGMKTMNNSSYSDMQSFQRNTSNFNISTNSIYSSNSKSPLATKSASDGNLAEIVSSTEHRASPNTKKTSVMKELDDVF